MLSSGKTARGRCASRPVQELRFGLAASAQASAHSQMKKEHEDKTSSQQLLHSLECSAGFKEGGQEQPCDGHRACVPSVTQAEDVVASPGSLSLQGWVPRRTPQPGAAPDPRPGRASHCRCSTGPAPVAHECPLRLCQLTCEGRTGH